MTENEKTTADKTALTDKTAFSVGEEGTSKVTCYEQAVQVQHRIVLWTGQSVLTPEDHADGTGALVESVRAAKGAKHLIDPRCLDDLKASKKRFITLLEDNGIRFGGCWIVAAANWEALQDKLDAEVKTFAKLRQEFLWDYQGNLDAWCASHPHMAASIRAAAPSQREMESKIQGAYLGLRIQPVNEQQGQKLHVEMQTDLRSQLSHELSVKAREFVRTRMDNAKAGKLQSFKTLQGIASKLTALSFVGEGKTACDLADGIRAELNALQPRGCGTIQLDEEGMQRLTTLCAFLSDPEMLRGVLDGRLPVKFGKPAVAAPAPAVAAPAPAPAPAPAVPEEPVIAEAPAKSKRRKTRKAEAVKPADPAPVAPVAKPEVKAEVEPEIPAVEIDEETLAELAALDDEPIPAEVTEALKPSAPKAEPAPVAPAAPAPAPAVKPVEIPDVPPAADIGGFGGFF